METIDIGFLNVYYAFYYSETNVIVAMAENGSIYTVSMLNFEINNLGIGGSQNYMVEYG